MKNRGVFCGVVAAVVLGVLAFVPTHDVTIREGKQVLVAWTMLLLLGSFLSSAWLRAAYWSACVAFFLRFNLISYFAFHLILVYVLSFEAVSRFSERGWISKFSNVFRILTLIQLLWMGLQIIHRDPIFTDLTDNAHPLLTGAFDNTMFAGAYLAIVSPLFLKGWWKVCLPVILAGLVGTKSFGAVLVFGVVLAWSLWRLYPLVFPHLMVFTTSSLAAAGCYCVNHALWKPEGWIYRVQVWKASINFLLVKPVMLIRGFGWGQFGPAFKGWVDYTKLLPAHLDWTHAHNDFLQLTFEGGVITLFLVLAWIYTLLKPCLASNDPDLIAWVGSVFAFLLVATYAFPCQLASLSVVAWVLFIGLESVRRSTLEKG